MSAVTPKATVVVVPRERFATTRSALESLFEHTTIPFDLIYIDGNSPRKIQSFLAQQAETRQFMLIRSEYYLTPTEARNLALPHIRTPYVAFVDNDVYYTDAWLEKLLECAEQTGAALVSPLICQNLPLHTEVHCAGGAVGIEEKVLDGKPARVAFDRIRDQGKQLNEVKPGYRRSPTGLVEFHCVLVRREVLTQGGPFDERLRNTREHLDLCQRVRAQGHSIWFEPDSIVTYVGPPPLALSDLHYYMLRWSDEWYEQTMEHLRQKWNLSEKMKSEVSWRRHRNIVRPIARTLFLGKQNRRLENVVFRFEKRLNRWLTAREARLRATARPPVVRQPHPKPA